MQMCKDYTLGGRQCHAFGEDSADICMICGVGSQEEGEIAAAASLLYGQAAAKACKLILFESEDWNRDFSPWAAEAVFGKEPFAGEAPATLQWLRDMLIPRLEEEKAICAGSKKYLAGYSLSGLFALWAFWESELFDGAASCSGSLWFPGWAAYMESPKRTKEGIVYLSLGDREEKTRNKVMAAVGNNTRNTYRILKENPFITKAALEWNEGGHFSNPTERLVKGMLWLLRQEEDYADDPKF